MKTLLFALCVPVLALAAPKPLFQSRLITAETPGHAVEVDIGLDGAREIFLVVTDGGNGIGGDWADWAEPRFVKADGSEIRLTEVEWKSAVSGWGSVRVNANAGGQQLRSAGRPVEYGIGTHSNSVIAYNVPDGAVRFKAQGVLDEGGTQQKISSSVDFRVYKENPGPLAASSAGGVNHEPEAATEQLDVHEALQVQLFASEPMVLSPSSMDVDYRGRVWVCEVVNYRKHSGERADGDRILILEDTDGDAKADKSTVFYQGKDVDSAHGICVLGNRALISCGDDVFWLIDENGDDKADRKELMFTKIGGAQHDHGIHAFHYGPDGRLYFNFGNAGKQLCDKDGKLITDIHGVKCTNQNNRPYQEGMVFRCDLDGGNVELLAWNFRNNWEVAVDSFGTLWQSDNDDDGNQGVRINYVMEFGNYGYRDEMTGAGWQSPRLGWESEVPRRHWHLNDPGVVPNLLQTGAGSPTGMQVYEGSLLPEIFRGQPIHCDAGPNVVRAYVTHPDGAGYTAEAVNILQGARNRWFRPSDVGVAPDGSLIVADWYDPGVGGHGMGDVTRGRLFRVTVASASAYKNEGARALDNPDAAMEWLRSANEDRRYLALESLRKFRKLGIDVDQNLKRLFADKQAKPLFRARALWALADLSKVEPVLPADAKFDIEMSSLVNTALADADESLRVTGVRVARQLWQKDQPEKLRELVAQAVKNPSPAVRREAALALRFDTSGAGDELWADLAVQTPDKDRWMIEALGIGADLRWPLRIQAMMTREPQAWKTTGTATELHLDSRSPLSPGYLAGLLVHGKTSGTPLASSQSLRILRALQLQASDPLLQSEVAVAARKIFHGADDESALAAATLLSRDVINKEPANKKRLDTLLKPVIGKPEFITLVEKLNLSGFEKELLDYIIAHPEAPESVNAARLLAANAGNTLAVLKSVDAKSAKSLIAALGRVSDRASVAVMSQHFWPEKREDVRRAIVAALALSGEGGRLILRWQGEGKFPEAFKEQAALALSRSTDAGVRNQAATELPLPAALGLADFPKLPELLKLKGDAAKGQAMFMQGGCVACHRVKGQYVDFGPDLSTIGGKLSAEGLFTAILYPSAAVEHSFVGQEVTMKTGQTLLGYTISETDAELTLRIAGGAAQPVPKSSITKRQEMTQSLMPPGLAATLGAQGLADLVAWLQTLK